MRLHQGTGIKIALLSILLLLSASASGATPFNNYRTIVKWGARTNSAVKSLLRIVDKTHARSAALTRSSRRPSSKPIELLTGAFDHFDGSYILGINPVSGPAPHKTRLLIDGGELRLEAQRYDQDGRAFWKKLGRLDPIPSGRDLTVDSYNLLTHVFGERLRSRFIKSWGKVRRELSPKN